MKMKIFAVAVTFAALAGCGQQSEPALAPVDEAAATTTVAAAASGITSVVAFEDALIVTAQIDGSADDPLYVFGVGTMLQDVVRAIQAGATDAPATASELDFSVSAAALDRLGNERTVQVLRLTLPMADLRAAQLDNLSVGRLLNLTTDMTFTPQGAQQIIAYCGSERGQRQSQEFCRLANRKAAG